MRVLVIGLQNFLSLCWNRRSKVMIGCQDLPPEPTAGRRRAARPTFVAHSSTHHTTLFAAFHLPPAQSSLTHLHTTMSSMENLTLRSHLKVKDSLWRATLFLSVHADGSVAGVATYEPCVSPADILGAGTGTGEFTRVDGVERHVPKNGLVRVGVGSAFRFVSTRGAPHLCCVSRCAV